MENKDAIESLNWLLSWVEEGINRLPVAAQQPTAKAAQEHIKVIQDAINKTQQ